MSAEILIVIGLIAVLSVVQSYFGMGLLLFGTPSLLLLGYDFHIALTYLLPASFVISLMQVLLVRTNRPPISKFLYIFCLPGIGLGLWAAGKLDYASWINGAIGTMLMATALIRLWPASTNRMNAFLRSNFGAYHLIMGLIHGLTNLGGALLVVLANGVATDKNQIRYTIAHYYLLFSFVQLFILATVMDHLQDVIDHGLTAAVSGAIYLILGNRIFDASSAQTYSAAMTVFIAAFGTVLILKF